MVGEKGMKNVMTKTTFREIKSSFGRWAAILSIVALGVGFFCGLKMCKDDFVKTGDDYITRLNLYNYELMTTLGLEEEDVDIIAAIEGVAAAEGAWSADVLFTVADSYEYGTGEDGPVSEHVAKLHTLTEITDKLSLTAGRMPDTPQEVIGDCHYFSEADLGKTIFFPSSNDEDTLDLLAYDSYTLVGLANSPAYLNFERGSTSLGSGSVSCFLYLPKEGWDSDIYTEIYVDFQDDFPIFTAEYDENADRMEERLEAAMETVGQRRYDAIIDESRDKLSDAQAEVDDAQAELDGHKADLAKAQADLADGQKEIDDNRKKLADARADLADARKELDENRTKLEDGRKEYEDGLSAYQQEKESTYAQLDGALAAGYMSQQEYEAAKLQADQQFAAAWQELEAARIELETGEARLAEGEKKVADGEAEVADGEKKLKDGEAELADGRKEIADAEKKLAEGEEKIADARRQLRDAEKEIDDIEYPTTYVLGRDTNIGYACFENDSKIVDGIARVFPVFFFLVAALVCMTTMTRMIDEQRTQIGVLKALGYSRNQILRKYVIYSGSAAILGAVIGYFIGVHLFPWVIWAVYGIMYGFADIIFLYSWPLGLGSLLVALLCCVGTTMLSCNAELKEVPAQLIRPKAPQAGKRVLLERVPFIWNRLKFLVKVSIRNTFRYRRRFIMMVIGISGCTALLITGLGIRDSIANVVSAQYDNIYHVDYTVSFQKDMDDAAQQQFLEETNSVVADALFLYTSSVDARANDLTKSINLVVCDESDDISGFISLYNDDGPIAYPSAGQGVINSNMAEKLGISAGDSLTVYDSDRNEMTVEITALCDNYVYNYLYIARDTYEENWGPLEINSAFVLGVENEDGQIADPHSDSTVLLDARNVSAVSITSDFRNRIDTMMKSLNYIVALVVASAGALAFIVIYNLTNINITERIREIATIKVLGFYANETAQYVFRENILLTAIAALVGIPLGSLLHAYVMAQVKIDMLSFDVHVEPVSYLIGILITFVFAFLVNLVMQRKLSHVSMTESLKSIE